MEILLIIVAVLIVILLFPIFINFVLFWDINYKKVFYAVILFGKIKLFGGYLQIIKEGIVLHLSEKKAIILPLKIKQEDLKKNFKLFKNYKITSFKSIVEIGADESIVAPYIIASINKIITDTAFFIIKIKKNNIKLKNDYLIIEGEDKLKISANITFKFSLLIVLITISKILLGSIINAKY